MGVAPDHEPLSGLETLQMLAGASDSLARQPPPPA
jgi:hypothetical protein